MALGGFRGEYTSASAASRQIIDEIWACTSHAVRVLALRRRIPLTFRESWDDGALSCAMAVQICSAARRVDMETAVIIDVVINTKLSPIHPVIPSLPLPHPSISCNHAEFSVFLHRPGSKCRTIFSVGQQDTLRPPSSRQPGRSEHKHYELIGLDHPQVLDFSCFKPPVPYS